MPLHALQPEAGQSAGGPIDTLQLHQAQHPLLHAKAASFLAARDYSSAYFVASRLVESLQHCTALIQLGAAEPNGSEAEVEARRAQLRLEQERARLILALAQYHSHGGARGSSAAFSAPFPAASPTGEDAPHASGTEGGFQPSGGAAYAYQLLREHHAVTEENRLFFAQCW